MSTSGDVTYWQRVLARRLRRYRYWRDERKPSVRRTFMIRFLRRAVRAARRKVKELSKGAVIVSGFGLDYSESRPSYDAMKRAGVNFVCRYLSNVSPTAPNATKTLSVVEASRLRAAGFPIVLVFETTAARATEGYEAGATDARTALRHCNILGVPASVPIYFAVDTDTTGPAVGGYFKGIGSVVPRNRIGAYGGIRPISWLFDEKLISEGWQTYAWSGHWEGDKWVIDWDRRADLRQYRNGVNFGGANVDYDDAVGPVVAWK